MSATARLAILVALNEELAALKAAFPKPEESGVILLRGGMGWNAASRATQSLLNSASPPDYICSSGFCGGLVAGIEVGDLVIANSLIGPEPGQVFTPPALTPCAVKCHSGALVTVKGAVFTGADKLALGQSRNAVAVDMETYAMVEAARGSKTKVFAIRTVSDGTGDDLPPEVGTFLTEDGRVRGTQILKFVAGGPRNVKTLWGLKSRSDKAGASLTAAWQALWPTLRNIL